MIIVTKTETSLMQKIDFGRVTHSDIRLNITAQSSRQNSLVTGQFSI